jgi:hypothetical protein
LVACLKAVVRHGIAQRFLQPASHWPGWILDHDQDLDRVESRLIVTGDGRHQVVVDGRCLSWEELGQALEPYEGWWFRLTFHDQSSFGP